MKIVGISDLHGYLPDNIPTCDVLCISGDIIPLRMQRNLGQSRKWWLDTFCKWVARLPCNKVIFTAGNHDFFLEDIYNSEEYPIFISKLKENTFNKAILLINDEYKYEDVVFYGFPYIRPIPFQESKWAFTDDYKGSNIPSVYDKLRDIKPDIIITHDNPFKNHLLTVNLKNSPKAWFFGHWHEGPEDRTKNFFNSSILSDTYSSKENFEIPTMEIDMKKDIIKEIFNIMIGNIEVYTSLKGYNNNQVDAIKEYLQINKDFFLRDNEDEIPLPVTGEVIDEEDEN